MCIRDTTRLPGPGRASSQVERLAGVGRLAQDVARDARGALGTLSCRIDQMRLAADETGLPELVRQQLAALYREVRSLTATLDRLTP